MTMKQSPFDRISDGDFSYVTLLERNNPTVGDVVLRPTFLTSRRRQVEIEITTCIGDFCQQLAFVRIAIA